VTWLSVRELLAHRRRAVLTGLAVVVGVALVSGTLVLGDTAVRAGVHDSDVDQLRRILLMAGGVALLVGAFIINTTISAVLAQRTRELALLRCLGAEPRQLRRMVRGEALAVGVVASFVGLVVGFGIAAALRAYVSSALLSSGHLPSYTLVVTPRTVAVALITGTVVMVVSAQAPARPRAEWRHSLRCAACRPPAGGGAVHPGWPPGWSSPRSVSRPCPSRRLPARAHCCCPRPRSP
jgi:ABC-type antimicrobial peptide transport system permease subunit